MMIYGPRGSLQWGRRVPLLWGMLVIGEFEMFCKNDQQKSPVTFLEIVKWMLVESPFIAKLDIYAVVLMDAIVLATWAGATPTQVFLEILFFIIGAMIFSICTLVMIEIIKSK